MSPIFILCILGTAVSLKYEVDESYWMIDNNTQLTIEQKTRQIKALNNERTILIIHEYCYGFGAISTFLAATGLVIIRRNI